MRALAPLPAKARGGKAAPHLPARTKPPHHPLPRHLFSDINECTNTTICAAKANTICFNLAGSYQCKCKAGYRLCE